MVVALIALLGAFGGSALADQAIDLARVKLLSGSRIKPHSISGNRLKRNTLAGAQIRESKLAKVPSARRADFAGNATTASHATTADSARNASSAVTAANAITASTASTLSGVSAARIDFRPDVPTPQTEILNFGGLRLLATCSSGPDLDLKAQSTTANAQIQSFTIDALGVTQKTDDFNFDPGDILNLLPVDDVLEVGQIIYSTPGGAIVTAQFQTDEVAFSGLKECLVSGHAFAS
jgi:hypothetical protein